MEMLILCKTVSMPSRRPVFAAGNSAVQQIPLFVRRAASHGGYFNWVRKWYKSAGSRLLGVRGLAGLKAAALWEPVRRPCVLASDRFNKLKIVGGDPHQGLSREQ